MKISASMFPALLGFDPFLSPYAAGAQLLGLTDGPERSEAMLLGLQSQAWHAEVIERDGYAVMPAPAEGFVHPEHDWIVGHPDGLIGLFGKQSPLELKLRGLAPSDSVRTRDVLQMLVYVSLLGASVGMVSWLHGGHGGVVREHEIINHDEELWQAMVAHVAVLRAGLLDGKLPDPDGSDSTREAIRLRYAESEPGKTIRLDRDQFDHVRAIRKLDEIIAVAKQQRERHAQLLQEVLGDATHAIDPYDQLAVRWQERTSSRVDTPALRKAHPEIAGEFTRTYTTRPFEVKP